MNYAVKYFVLICTISFDSIRCQPPLQWVKLAGETIVETRLISTDASGKNDVVVAGRFLHTSDFDPGIGTYTMNATPYEPFILKLDSAGNFVWVHKLDCNTGNAIILTGMQLNSLGDIYMCGWVQGYADLDPGPGTYSLVTSSSDKSGFLLKLNAAGNFLWARQFAGGEVLPKSLVLDDNQQVYVTGDFKGQADFTPGAPSNSFASTSHAPFTLKISPSGTWRWVKIFTGGSLANAACLDYYQGAVLIGGYTTPGVDFDPGSGVQIAQASGGFLCRLDTTNGQYLYSGFLTGDVSVWSVAASDTLGILVGGRIKGSVDVDPGSSLQMVGSSGEAGFILKLKHSGSLEWVRTIGSMKQNSLISMRLVPAGSRFYMSTYLSYDTVDFDPGPGVVLLSAHLPKFGWCDITFSEFDSTGILTWAYSIGPTGYDAPQPPLALDGLGALISTGIVTDSLDVDPRTSSYVLDGTKGNLFIQKLAPCRLPSAPVIQSTGQLCTGHPATLTATGSGGIQWYNMPSGGMLLGNGTPYITAPLSGPATFYASASTCAPSFSRAAVSLSPQASPNVTMVAGSNVICPGDAVVLQAAGAQSYVWSHGLSALASHTVSPLVTTQYVVTGFAASGCAMSVSVTVTVDACTDVGPDFRQGSGIVFPNPVNDELVVKLHAESKLELQDETGRVVLSVPSARGTTKLSLSALPHGAYQLTISNKSYVETHKLIK